MYKYTFKMYVRDKIAKLWECVQSNLIYPIALIGGPLGILIMDIIIYRNYNGAEDITLIVFLTDMAWVVLCTLIGVVVNYIVEDFRYEKRSKEWEFAKKEQK